MKSNFVKILTLSFLFLTTSCSNRYSLTKEELERARSLCSCNEGLWYVRNGSMFQDTLIKCGDGTYFLFLPDYVENCKND